MDAKVTNILENNSIARIDNFLIYHGKFKLTAKEQKIVLFLASRINPIKQSRLHAQIVPIKALKQVMAKKKGGSFYKEIQSMSARLVKKGIEFPTNVKYEGKVLIGYRNWFQSIEPIVNEEGEICLEFLFSEKLIPFLLDLKEYTQINYLETLPMGSSFSVRMFLIFRAHRDKSGEYRKKSVLRYQLSELKDLLGVIDKYQDYRNFRKFVLEVLEKEINKETSIGLKWKPLKKGRSVAAVEFEFWDKKKTSPKGTQKALLSADKLTFDKLTFAQLKAFDRLVAYGIDSDIALQMLYKIKSSETAGFEDWYFEEVETIFERKTMQSDGAAKAGTLVNWFIKLKIFEQGDHFATIIERLQARKKQLQKERPDAWDNRLMAKAMTSAVFKKKFEQ